MWNKIKCLFGFHVYRSMMDIDEFYEKVCRNCEFYKGDCNVSWCYNSIGKHKKVCKYCGSIDR